MRPWRPVLIAFQFLTRLPIRLSEAPDNAEIGLSILFYPLVGGTIGIALAGLALSASLIHVPPMPVAALILAAWVLVTGGLHLDGLADSADAWAGCRGDRGRALTLMKDPHCGPMGVTVLVLVLLAKFASITALITHGHGLSIALVPLLGRTALPFLFAITPYVRPNGLGSVLSAHLPRTATVVTSLIIFLFVAILGGIPGVTAVVASLSTFALLRFLMKSMIGGTTGDTAGAMVEIIEAVAAIAVAAII